MLVDGAEWTVAPRYLNDGAKKRGMRPERQQNTVGAPRPKARGTTGGPTNPLENQCEISWAAMYERDDLD
ncbi:hypothetical protein QE152_g6199 [Popillia japonica]|uniref:Transposase n=1 Tax=Popillia japonica TaxID=7064 RepID=A0AAW1MJF4_POPJA